MISHICRRHLWLALIGCLAIAALSSLAPPATAAEGEYGNALDWVPADASCFSSSLRIKEQIEIVAESNAWKTFREIPSVATVWAMAEMQVNNPNGPAAMFWQLMELPENQQLAKLLGEMFSHEIVFYAGADFQKTLELLSVIQGSRVAPIIAALEGEQENAEEIQVQMVAAAIEEDPALLDVPEIVLAFKVEDADAAETQLKRLEVFANMALQQTDLEREVEREEIGESEFLVLKLDGSMIPWEDEAPEGLSLDEETYENLKNVISEKELTIALGEWNGYMLLSIAASTDHLAKLGEGELLSGNGEFDRIKPHLDGKVVGVQYASETLVAQQYGTAEDLDAIATMIDESLQESEEIPAELKERISKDLPELAADIKPYVPKAGAMVACTVMTDTGFETYKYNWSEKPRIDATRPLEILDHLGGSPLIAVAARGESKPEDYDALAKWVGKAIGYFEDFALEQMDEDDREEAAQALEIARPLLKRLDETTREHLAPALADGQSGIVLDADITSKQWQEEMPESFNELPMLELGIVMGVSDAEEFKTAMREYQAILNDLVDAIREADPDSIPEGYEIPEPEKQETSDGAVYSWRFNEAELDEQLALCIGLSEDYAIFGTSPALAERVLAEKPIEPLSEELDDEPRAVVAGIHFAALVEAAAPWVQYAIRANHIEEEQLSQDPEDDPSEVSEIWSQVETGLEILKCFRGAWSETREDEGVWVTRSVTVFEDLEAQEEE